MSHKNILIIGPAWVGDMVMAHTLFQLLRQTQPNAALHVLAPAWAHPLLDRMPEVDQNLESPFAHDQLLLRQRFQFAKTLRKTIYQQAILLPNSFKSALIPYWANVPKRTGWMGEYRYGLLNDMRHLNKMKYPKMLQRFAALAFPPDIAFPTTLPVPRLCISKQQLNQTLIKHGVKQTGQPVLALCPGAEFGDSKRWPVNYYSDIANQKLSTGWGVWLFGSKKDVKITDHIQAQTQHRCVNLAGHTTLGEAIDLLSLTAVVVTNDSGLMHIAAALSKPIVALYGSSSPGFTPPLTENARILKTNLACQPCFKRVCPLKHHQCMQLLLPDQVLAAIGAL